MSPLQRSRPAALLGVLSLLLLGQAPAPSPDQQSASLLPLPMVAKDLAGLGFAVTTGAAAGFVDEASCAFCHTSISETYRDKGMARAFRRPRPENDIENFAAPPFVHAPSGQSFQIARDGGRLVFRRWQMGPDGQPINGFEIGVDWILGSGDHARTYLYRTAGGELYQLPLAWYSQERSWGMAPGFDRPDHDGILRRVRRECVFCHTSYPDVPAGADAYGAPQSFPAQLPEGVGCQRCHGPAAEHVWLALGGLGSNEEIRSSVFNPGRLPAPRRDEVCQGCHFQPSVALPGLRRFGRGDYSFRPGEPLGDYLVQVEVEEEGRPPGERFEINHHPYRLRQSRCWIESRGALSCLTCHDPHRRVPQSARAAHYRAACLTCHKVEDCGLPKTGIHAKDSGDCVSCHMAKRRTQDVVHVVMTDHRIQRRPGGPELLATLAETDPVLTGIRLLGTSAPQGALGEVYRAAAVVRMTASVTAIEHLEKMLASARPPEPEPWLDLAQGQLKLGRFADADHTLISFMERFPNQPLAQEWLALARAGQGKTEEAIAILEKTLESIPDRAEAEYNLGRLLAFRNRPQEAETHLGRAVSVRPNLAPAWYHLGEVSAALGRTDAALGYWRHALEIDPTHTGAYVSLGKSLLAKGDRVAALRWLRQGARVAAKREAVTAVLREAESTVEQPGQKDP